MSPSTTSGRFNEVERYGTAALGDSVIGTSVDSTDRGARAGSLRSLGIDRSSYLVTYLPVIVGRSSLAPRYSQRCSVIGTFPFFQTKS